MNSAPRLQVLLMAEVWEGRLVTSTAHFQPELVAALLQAGATAVISPCTSAKMPSEGVAAYFQTFHQLFLAGIPMAQVNLQAAVSHAEPCDAWRCCIIDCLMIAKFPCRCSGVLRQPLIWIALLSLAGIVLLRALP